MSSRTVSIIIPTFNHAQVLSRAIDSVLCQTYKLCEVIVVDDGSHDGTRDVVGAYGNQIAYIYQGNRGLSAARNTGLRAATGDYIQFLDADDTIHVDKLAVQVALLEKLPLRVAGVACRYAIMGPNGEHLELQPEYQHREVGLQELILGNQFSVQTLLVRRECLTADALFDERLKACEDWDLWLRLAATHTFVTHNDVLADYVRAGVTMRDNPVRMGASYLRVLRKAFRGPELASRFSPQRARSYAHAFFQCSQGFYSQQQLDRGRRYFLRALQIDPGLLNESWLFDTFEEFFKPFGHSHKNLSGRQFATVNREMLRVLNRLFTGPYAAACSSYRHTALEYAYTSAVRRSLKAGSSLSAFHYRLANFFLDPVSNMLKALRWSKRAVVKGFWKLCGNE
ncbi:MAG: glycosyltransferase [Nitrososphaera sp.]|nr:glycosyltransferase [Nitrososphaera sp.]